MPRKDVPMMRLALREQGSDWVAYIAPPDTMEGAQEIARIRIGAVTKHRELRDLFMELAKRTVELAVADIGPEGARVESWGEEESAPESERSGNA